MKKTIYKNYLYHEDKFDCGRVFPVWPIKNLIKHVERDIKTYMHMK